MDICVQVGASGAVVHLKSSKIWGVSAGFTTILRANSLPYFFLVCQNLSQRKSRWTDLRTSRNKESRRDISWPVFNPQFKKRLSWGGHSYGNPQSSELLASFLNKDGRMAWHFQISPSFNCHNFDMGPQREKICPGVLECCIAASHLPRRSKASGSIKKREKTTENGLRTGRRRFSSHFRWFSPFSWSSHSPLTLARFQVAGLSHAEQNMSETCKVCSNSTRNISLNFPAENAAHLRFSNTISDRTKHAASVSGNQARATTKHRSRSEKSGKTDVFPFLPIFIHVFWLPLPGCLHL